MSGAPDGTGEGTTMAGDDRQRAPFEEQAALEELERLLGEIERSRERRRKANDAFDEFVGAFEKPAPAAGRAVRGPVARAGTTAPLGEGRTAGPQQGGPQAASPAAGGPFATGPDPDAGPGDRTRVGEHDGIDPPVIGASHPDEAAVPAVLAPPAHMPRLPRGAVLGLAAAGAALLLVFVLRERAPDSAEPVAPADAPAPVTTPVPVPAEAPQSQEPTPSVVGTRGTELATLRRVWVRVTLDGEPAIERELQGDARVPLAATETIVIRAGDGGAVRLFIAGTDQGLLGSDGQVVTRTFRLR